MTSASVTHETMESLGFTSRVRTTTPDQQLSSRSLRESGAIVLVLYDFDRFTNAREPG